MGHEIVDLGMLAIKRVAASVGMALVGTLSAWTNTNVGLMQGLCVSAVVLIIATLLDRTAAHTRLLKRVCMLYCSQQVRRLFVSNDYSPAGIFTDVLLAMGIAVTTMIAYSDNARELKTLLDGLLFLYGDVLDFAFQYGTLKVTVCAFGASIFFKYTPPPKDHMPAFCRQMACMISANLLSQGMTSMIAASPNLQILQCIAATCVLRLLLPDMQSYLTFLAAQQLLLISPGAAPVCFCAVAALDIFPASSRVWVQDICVTYILLSIASAVLAIPSFWGMILVLVLAHYAEHILDHCQPQKKI